MTVERIKIASNDRRISDEESNITRTVDMMTKILELYKQEGVKLSDDEVNKLIQSTYGDITVDKIAHSKCSKKRPKEQLEEYSTWIDDIKLAFKLYPGLQLSMFSYYVYCEKGIILVKENALKEIEDNYTYYITEEKDIELYNRHKKLVEDANQLSEDLRENAGNNFITSAFLLHFNVDGSAYAPNTFKYGK